MPRVQLTSVLKRWLSVSRPCTACVLSWSLGPSHWLSVCLPCAAGIPAQSPDLSLFCHRVTFAKQFLISLSFDCSQVPTEYKPQPRSRRLPPPSFAPSSFPAPPPSLGGPHHGCPTHRPRTSCGPSGHCLFSSFLMLFLFFLLVWRLEAFTCSCAGEFSLLHRDRVCT